MAEQATINLNVKTDESQKSLRAMRQELKQLQIAMDQASDPAEFKRLEAEFAVLRNDMRDTSAAMKYLDPGELLSGWTKMAQGAVGAFGAVTGAMSLFGNESEEIQAIEKKSMVLIQTMMGLEQARQLLIDGGGKAERKTLISSTAAWLKKTLGIGAATTATAANTAATVAQTTATGAQTVATTGATVATKVLGAAMKALPIFAIIGGIVAIAQALSRMNKENEEAKKRQEEINSSLQAYVEASKKLDESYAAFSESVRKAQLDHKLAMGEITQQEYDSAKAQQDAIDSLDEVRRSYAEATVAANAAANKKMEDENIRYAASVDRLRRTDFHSEEGRQKAIENATRIHNEKIAAINAERQESVSESEAVYLKARSEAEQKYVDDLEEARNAERERQRKAYEAYLSDLRSWQDKVRNMQIEMIDDELERAVAKNEEDRKRAIRDLNESKLNAQQKADALLTIQQYYDDKRAEMTDEYVKKQREKEDAADKDLRSTKENTLRLNLDNAQAYYDSLLAAEGIDEEEYKAILDRKRQATYDYYDGLLKVAVEFANADGVRSEEELAAIDAATKARDEYAKTAVDGQNAVTDATDESTDALKDMIEALGRIGEKLSNVKDSFDDMAGNLSSTFANLTELMTMEIDAQDAAWQESYDARSQALDDELEKAEEVWGRESEQYKYLLKQQQDAADAKADHDADIEKKRKAAESKYKKASIATDMATATSDFAMASFEVWAKALSKLLVGGIPMALALQAMLAASYGTQMGVMAKQMSLVGKMRLGGPVFGPSHESGGVDRNLEGGEFVINAQSMKVPGVAQLANSLNRTGQGGSAPVVSRIDKEDISEIVGAIAAIPVVVSERDITGTQRRVAVIESKTSF